MASSFLRVSLLAAGGRENIKEMKYPTRIERHIADRMLFVSIPSAVPLEIPACTKLAQGRNRSRVAPES